MKRKREEIKADLMRQFEQWVEEALQVGESQLSLTEMEDMALGVRQQVGQQLISCPACQHGIFSLDDRWELDANSLSPEVAQQAVWLSSLLPYEQAAQVLGRMERATPDRYWSEQSACK